jgi:hypothetical protein
MVCGLPFPLDTSHIVSKVIVIEQVSLALGCEFFNLALFEVIEIRFTSECKPSISVASKMV